MHNFSANRSQHRALGELIHLRLGEQTVLRLTPAEASSLSFALTAVRNGISPEREIYMSPIASDTAFVGNVHAAGISIVLNVGTMELNWNEVGSLAATLAHHIN